MEAAADPAASRLRPRPPAVLLRLFPEESHSLLPLHAALRRLLSRCAPRLEPSRRGDAPPYRLFLSSTLVAFPTPLFPPLPPTASTTNLMLGGDV